MHCQALIGSTSGSLARSLGNIEPSAVRTKMDRTRFFTVQVVASAALSAVDLANPSPQIKTKKKELVRCHTCESK